MVLKDTYLKLVVFTVYSLMYDHWARPQIGENKSNPLRSNVILSTVLLVEVSFDVMSDTFSILPLFYTLLFDEKNCIYHERVLKASLG